MTVLQFPITRLPAGQPDWAATNSQHSSGLCVEFCFCTMSPPLLPSNSNSFQFNSIQLYNSTRLNSNWTLLRSFSSSSVRLCSFDSVDSSKTTNIPSLPREAAIHPFSFLFFPLFFLRIPYANQKHSFSPMPRNIHTTRVQYELIESWPHIGFILFAPLPYIFLDTISSQCDALIALVTSI